MKQINKYKLQANPAPDTGKLLTAFYKKKRISKAALARTLNRSYNTVAAFQKNSTIQTAVLWELCHALKHNFFADLAAQLPPLYTTNVAADTTKDERMDALQQENALLNAKNEALMEALKGK